MYSVSCLPPLCRCLRDRDNHLNFTPLLSDASSTRKSILKSRSLLKIKPKRCSNSERSQPQLKQRTTSNTTPQPRRMSQSSRTVTRKQKIRHGFWTSRVITNFSYRFNRFYCSHHFSPSPTHTSTQPEQSNSATADRRTNRTQCHEPVSYTHLTLPTKRIV